jgi:hypothetical protein
MSCQTCGGKDLTVVGFETADRATFRYCRFCEGGWWEARGEKVAIGSILQAAATIEPARRRA